MYFGQTTWLLMNHKHKHGSLICIQYQKKPASNEHCRSPFPSCWKEPAIPPGKLPLGKSSGFGWEITLCYIPLAHTSIVMLLHSACHLHRNQKGSRGLQIPYCTYTEILIQLCNSCSARDALSMLFFPLHLLSIKKLNLFGNFPEIWNQSIEGSPL